MLGVSKGDESKSEGIATNIDVYFIGYAILDFWRRKTEYCSYKFT